MEINNCYILQSKIGETLFFDLWTALAIYAPNQFLLRFIKPSVLSKEEENQLRSEALQDYRLIHSGVDTVVEADFFKDRLFISSEYQNQVLLRDFPKTKIKTDPVWIEKLVLHLAKALEFFHIHRLLYGVFLPESVLVARNGSNPEDFTFLKPGYRSTLSALVKQKNAPSSYLSFIAPELLSGGTPSIAGDLYSFGKLMGFLFESVVVPPALDRIIKTCALPEPKNRYPDGATLIKDIEGLLKVSAPESFFILPSTGELGREKQNPSTARTQTPSPLPVSQARTEVLNYFQEISANYRSEHGYSEESDPHTPPATPSPATLPPNRTTLVAPSRPRTAPLNGTVTSAARDDYYSQWSQPASSPVTNTAPPTQAPKPTAPGAPEGAPGPVVSVTGRPGAAGPIPSVPAPAGPATAVPAPATPGPVTGASAESPSPGMASASLSPEGSPGAVPAVAVPPVVTGPEGGSEEVPGGASGEPVRWQYHCVSLEAVEKTLVRTFTRSKKGIGDFRFIQEPRDTGSQERLNRVLLSLAQESFFIDAGSLCGAQKADVGSFFAAIQGALEKPLIQEPPRARRRFGSLISLAGGRSFFRTAPLGSLLFGDGAPKEGPPETFGKTTSDGLIEALTCFGRKKRPQVIVARGSECIGADLSEFLIEFARKIRHKSVCVFIFGREFPAEFRRFRSETLEPTPYP